MESISAIVFIPLMIIAVTQIIKMLVPKVKNELTIVVALGVSIVVGVADRYIGVPDVSIAQAIVLGLSAVGISVAAAKAGGGAKGDQPVA